MEPDQGEGVKVNWKKNEKLKPQLLLDQLRSITTINEEGLVSYTAFEKHELDSVLLTMLQFDEEFSYSTTRKIYQEAHACFAKGDVFTKEEFLKQLNAAVVRHGKKKESTYIMITSISLAKGFPVRAVSTTRSVIKSCPKGLQRKFSSRLKHKWTNELPPLPVGYCPVTVTLKAKDKMDAFDAAIYELDYVRGVFSLFVNPLSEFNLWAPKKGSLNRIVLGGLHSLHHEDGSVVDEKLFWYERNYRVVKPTVIKSSEDVARLSKVIFKKVGFHKSHSAIKAAIVRYVRAFDEHDKNVVILKLWAALESIVSPSENNADSIVRRCSFMFDDRPYHTQVLEHLREYRNRNVHTGQEVENLDYHCFQLQMFFKEAVLFYVSNYKVFPTLAAANKFLDLPSDHGELLHLKMSVNKALRYQRYYDKGE